MLKKKPYMSIVIIWHVFCNITSHSFSGRSGPGPLGPVRKILVVRSGPEGPQFARSVGTLVRGITLIKKANLTKSNCLVLPAWKEESVVVW